MLLTGKGSDSCRKSFRVCCLLCVLLLKVKQTCPWFNFVGLCHSTKNSICEGSKLGAAWRKHEFSIEQCCYGGRACWEIGMVISKFRSVIFPLCTPICIFKSHKFDLWYVTWPYRPEILFPPEMQPFWNKYSYICTSLVFYQSDFGVNVTRTEAIFSCSSSVIYHNGISTVVFFCMSKSNMWNF